MLNINLALLENENMNFKFVEQLMPPKMVLLKKMCTPSKMVLPSTQIPPLKQSIINSLELVEKVGMQGKSKTCKTD